MGADRATARVSVVVPCFNGARTLEACIASLRTQTRAPAEIIVVDDGSTDGSASLAERLGARVVTTPRKLRAGGARAAGFAASAGDHVAFVDADMVLAESWMADAVLMLESDPGLAAVGGAVTPPAGWNLFEWADYFMSFSAYMPGLPSSSRLFLPTNNMLVRRPLLERVRFLETYGDEDIDLSFQLLDAGKTLRFAPVLRSLHNGWRSTLSALVHAQRRYAVGFVAGQGRVVRTRRLLALPWLALVPVFTTLKIGQVVGRVVAQPRYIGMLALCVPLMAALLALRAHRIHQVRSGTP